MEPHQKIRYLFHTLLRKLFIFIGHDIFRDGEFKPYSATYFIYVLFIIFFLGAFKTLAFYNMTVVLNMIAFLGLACGKSTIFLVTLFQNVAHLFTIGHYSFFPRIDDENVLS